ncbi:ABC transporter permease [Mucilaginibacter limnophilus]|uniref:ABC transporter permease n=1 Tax=Mucilaginibacter limnophilus TaxID=1932778 RepID=A0A3S2Y3V8_9SPHI|nr:ABC transporter permease [Mucilaginibacter limnophilus]RVU02915.1 ABC transporter permease [Mucilaginibacter limnophilus]
MKKLLQEREAFLAIAIVLICIAASIAWPGVFPTFDNLSQVLLNLSIDAIVAVGMMLLLISGSFDLSVGSVVAFSGGITAYLLYYCGMYPLPAVLIGMSAAALVGFINGYLVAKAGINPMIQTLAMMGIIRGAALMISGSGIQNLPADFNVLGQSNFLGLQSPVWVMLLVVFSFDFLVSKNIFFRRYYYIGNNEKAAMLSGIKVQKLKITGFILASLLAGLAGILLASRLGASLGTSGKGMELRVITAAILGGASLSGGEGRIMGALLGTIFMAVISNIMIIARVSGYWQEMVLGLILILAVWIDIVLKDPRGLSLKARFTKLKTS